MGDRPRLIEPLAGPPDAVVPIPGSKSHTNRALICAALADGRSELGGILASADTDAMIEALIALGVGIELDADRSGAIVDGGRHRFRPGPLRLDVAQSGTTSRFLLPLLALGSGPYTLDGDPQLRNRPFGPLVDALRGLGASIEGQRLPMSVAGGGLVAGPVTVSGSISSQFLSGLLLAAPEAERGQATVEIELSDELVSRPYVELTIDTMARFGVDVTADDRRFSVPVGPYRPTGLAIEPDASAASYFFAAAAITGGRVRVDGLGAGTVQGDLGFVDVLAAMGADVAQGDDWTEVTGPDALRGVDVDLRHLSDTAQTLAVTATFATTPTTVRGVGFIRHKETDRIRAVVTELGRRGIRAEETGDGFVVHPGRPSPGSVDTYDDHRMAMSFALLGLMHPGIEIENPGCVSKTFPRFFAVLDRLR